jgi:hypothetical protein
MHISNKTNGITPDVRGNRKPALNQSPRSWPGPHPRLGDWRSRLGNLMHTSGVEARLEAAGK